MYAVETQGTLFATQFEKIGSNAPQWYWFLTEANLAESSNITNPVFAIQLQEL